MKKILFLFFSFSTLNLQAYNPEHLAKYKNGDTNLQNLDLSGALLQGANFENKNLSGTNLSDTNLFFANFRNANLTNAKLTFTFAIYTDFSGANLTGTNLTNFVCTFANFSNTTRLTDEQKEYLKDRGALFDQKIYEEKTKFLLKKSKPKKLFLKKILNCLSCCCSKK